MTEIMPVPRNLSFTVLPAGGLPAFFPFLLVENYGIITSRAVAWICL